MKKHNLDSLFKAKAGQGNFAPSPGNWADAEKLLNAAPKNGALSGGLPGGIISAIAVLIIGAAALLSFISTSAVNGEEITTNKIVNENPTIKSTDETPVEDTEINIALPLENNQTVINEKNSTIEATSENEAENFVRNTTASAVEKTPSRLDQRKTVTTAAPKKHHASAKSAGTNQAKSAKSERTQTASKANYSTPTRDKIMLSEIGAASSSSQGSEQIIYASSHLAFDENPSNIESIDPLPKPFKPSDNFTFAFGADYSYLFTNRFLTGNNNDYINFRNSYEKAQSITSFGINAQLGYGNWLFNTGIYQTTITEDVKYPSTLIVDIGIDNGAWNVNENWTYQTDSSWVVDSIYIGHWSPDTIWNVSYDSTYTAQWDTVQGEKEDPELAKNNGAHTLTYIEIPLWFGRSFGAKRFTFDVQGGFAVGFLTATKGARYINGNVDGLVPSADYKAQFQEVIFNAMLRAGMRFEIAPRWQVSFNPMLRYNLNSVLKQEGIRQKYLGYGLNLGLSYRF